MTTWIDQVESTFASGSFFFKIDDNFFFLIDDTYKLIIQAGPPTATWTDQNES